MSAPNDKLPPERRVYISQQEAAAQLHCDPDTVARSFNFPHALRRHGGWLVPWCCLLRLGVEHDKELILPSVGKEAA